MAGQTRLRLDSQQLTPYTRRSKRQQVIANSGGSVEPIFKSRLALWGWLAHPPSLLLFSATTALFALIAVWEWGSFHGGWIERMEARDWRLGHFLRRQMNRRRERRLARAARQNG